MSLNLTLHINLAVRHLPSYTYILHLTCCHGKSQSAILHDDFFCHRVIPLPASLLTSPPPHQSCDDPLCPRQSRSQSSPSPRLLRLLPWIVPINGSSTSRVRARRHIRRSRWQLPFPASMLFSDASSHTGAARSPPTCPSPRSTIVTLLDWI